MRLKACLCHPVFDSYARQSSGIIAFTAHLRALVTPIELFAPDHLLVREICIR